MADLNQNLGDLMAEAKKMQERMQDAQKQLTQLVVTGNAANMVSIKINGVYGAQSITINPTLLEEPEMLADLIIAAFNDAVRQVEKESKKKINELTASLNIPTGFMKEDENKGS